MPTVSGLTFAPLIRLFLLGLVSTSLLTTILDIKHHFYFSLPLLSRLGWTGWAWRVLGGWWMCYTNSADVLFAGVVVYQLRIVERIWGGRKVASFILATLPYTILLPPMILYTLNLLTFRSTRFFTTLPSGPTAIIFALLAQYHAAVPHAYRYRVSSPIGFSSTPTPATPPTSTPTSNTATTNATTTQPSPTQSATQEDTLGIILTSKSLSYLPALQLACSSLPGSLIPALAGWIIGYLWRWDMLPWPASSEWRISGRVWRVLGGDDGGRRGLVGGGVEGLRRRMEVGAADGAARERETGRGTGWRVESMLGGGGGRGSVSGGGGDRHID